MANFEIHGPFRLGFENRKGGRTLVFDCFWKKESEASYLADKCGCYVFAIRQGRALIPVYVGKATKTFKQETINNTNKHKFQNGFSEYAKGTPILFFVVHPKAKGKNNAKQIEEIEDFLIQAGAARNPNIQNVKGVQKPAWTIKGVVRSGAGKPSSAEIGFARLFDINN